LSRYEGKGEGMRWRGHGSHVRGIRALGMLAAVAVAGCSAAGSTGSAAQPPPPGRLERIVAAPKDVLAASQPQPNGTIWALAGSPASKGLFQISLTSGKGIGSLSVSNAAQSVTESLSGVVGLGLGTRTTGALELLSGTTGKVTQTVPLRGPAREVVVGSDGATFYVLDGNGKAPSVTIVNSHDGGVQGIIPVPPGTVSVVPDVQGATLYALQSDGQVSQVAVAGGYTMSSFPVGGPARSLALNPDGTELYVLKYADRNANVAEVDLATESVRRVIPAPVNCLQVLTSANGSELYQLVGTVTYGNIQVFAS
jgi:DNA-binding beta-propeller fold protein YncE